MTTNFILRSDKKTKPVTIYLRYRSTNVSWYFATSYTIFANQWNSTRGMPRKGKTPQEQVELSDLTDKLTDLEKEVLLFINRCIKKGRTCTKEDLKGIVNTFCTGQKTIGETIPYSITEYMDYLIAAMENGTFKFLASNYDDSTIKVWRNFRDIYMNFEKTYEQRSGLILEWSTIDKQVYDSFIAFCENRGYMTKSINKLLICFKALIRYSSEYHHLHNNTGCLKYFRKVREIEGCTKAKIYLNENEISALYNMPLPLGSLKDKVRDIFLVGCFTGQRVSDYAHLTTENFCYTSRGTKVIRLVQEKTGNYVIIPVLKDYLVDIVEKYDFKLPVISEVIINRYIKIICKELASTVPSFADLVKTVLTMREVKAENEGRLHFERDSIGNPVKHKYELVSTHTARRSLITNLYKSRLFSPYQIMSISGHKSESTFWGYLSESADEIAEEITQIKENYIMQKVAKNETLF